MHTSRKLRQTPLRPLLALCLAFSGACGGDDAAQPAPDASAHGDGSSGSDAGDLDAGPDTAPDADTSGDGDADGDGGSADGDSGVEADAGALDAGTDGGHHPDMDAATGDDAGHDPDVDATTGEDGGDTPPDAGGANDAGADAAVDAGAECVPSDVVADTFAITSPGSYFAIDGVNSNPAITLQRGSTYEFVVTTSSSHPFSIRTGASTSSPLYNDGVTNNDTNAGTITFEVPCDAPDTLRYVCSIHGFGNTITIE